MVTRILIGLLIALVALAGGGALYFQRLSTQHAARIAALESDLGRARSEATRERERADKLTTKATELDAQLGNAKTRTTATESKNSQLSRDLHAAKSSLSERQQREIALLTEIEALRQQIKFAPETSGLPASTATINSPASATSVTTVAASAPLITTAAPPPSSATITSEPLTSAGRPAESDNEANRERIAVLEAQLTDLLTRALAEPLPPPAAPAPSRTPSPYQVVRVGPADAFVVVDFGTSHGASLGDELVLCRGTSVIARVQISDARAKFSIAQVLPAALKGQLQPGDFVLIAK